MKGKDSINNDILQDNEIQRKNSHSKTFVSREVFVQQDRKKRRMHSNSILQEVRLSQKINQDQMLLLQQKNLRKFENSKKNSLRIHNSRLSEIDFRPKQFGPSCPLSNFRQSENKITNRQYLQVPDSQISQQFPLQTDQNFPQKSRFDLNMKKKSMKQFVVHNLRKKSYRKAKKTNDAVLGSINTKLRQLNVISRTFDKVNESYCIDSSINQKTYNKSSSQAEKILKEFESRLNIRKNLITQRKTSFKKNTKIEYRYKVMPKRYQTQFIDRENNQLQANLFEVSEKYRGVWHQDARKLKNYISGGYSDQKQQYSDLCDLDDYRKLKRNFLTFQQIYNSIKQDKDNPIGKIMKKELKNPNILQVISVLQKQQQLQTLQSN